MKKVIPDTAGKDYWNACWAKLPPVQLYQGPVFEHHPVLQPFLSVAGGGEAIEVGCVPGNFMVYLAKEFGYKVSGIDYSECMEYVERNLELNGIPNAGLFNAELFAFVPPRKYDLVFSVGFVEHFDDYQPVIDKHVELAAKGGLIVVIVPNLTHLHRVLCGCFAPEVLKIHRFPLMHAEVLRRSLEKAGATVLHCQYNRTFRPTYVLPRPFDWVSRGVQKGLRLLHLDNFGNRFASPYLISVSRKD